MLKVWNMALIFATFELCLLGTFLTRSGVISSVHAFAQSSIGTWFMTFILLTLASVRFPHQEPLASQVRNTVGIAVSRESSFLFNNLLLLVVCFHHPLGTFFPIISEFVQGHKVTVGPPFFNRVACRSRVAHAANGCRPAARLAQNLRRKLKRNFLLPAIGSVAVGVMMIVLGVRPWEDPSYFYAVMAAVLSALVIFTVISEFVRGGRVIAGKSHQNLFGAMIHLYHRNTDATEAISSTSASPGRHRNPWHSFQ